MRNRSLIVAVALLALAACASAPCTPQVTRIEVPVPVPCRLPAIERPAFAVDALPLGANIWEQMKALRAERAERRAYEAKLEAAQKSCQ